MRFSRVARERISCAVSVATAPIVSARSTAPMSSWRTVVRNVEVPSSYPRRVAWKSLAKPEKRALRRPCRLISQLGIPHLPFVHLPRELLGDFVRIELLKRQSLIAVHDWAPRPRGGAQS